MCFSATASFLASGGLAVSGGIALSAAKKNERLLAGMPLLFALQQFIEGLQWLSVHPSTACTVYGYGFLILAFILWPIYFPLTAYQIETNTKNKQSLKWFVGVGSFLSLVLSFILFSQPLSVEIHPNGILYFLGAPDFPSLRIAYCLIICGSFLLSTKKFLRYLGTAIFLAAIITCLVTYYTYTSVWCFFSAIFSLTICLYFLRKKSKTKNTFFFESD